MRTIDTDPAGVNVTAVRHEVRRAADILRFNIAGAGFHFHVVAMRHRDLILHPELCSARGRSAQLRRKRSVDFDAFGHGLCGQRVAVEQMLRKGAASVGLDMNGVAHFRRGTGLDRNDAHRTEIRGKPQSESLFRGERAAAVRGNARSRWIGFGEPHFPAFRA